MTRLAQVDMNAVAPLLPGDKVAGRVASRGEHFDFKAPENHFHSDVPPLLRAPLLSERNHPNFTDWTGMAIGRLTVVGLDASLADGHKRWVVRCVCGSYEHRKSKFIKHSVEGRIPAHDAMCVWCSKTQKLQLGIGVKRDGPLVKIEGYK
ncbi:hypothetical protein PH552_12215 [Rhizobium sp. CNPSo 3968]|uniref:hypothetical protein n=1 Tax=Rhizobium sp. CNPSo 3968 TaxID=3021408 RepID=UPI0025509686|nr:hypothetical protein [Rhizobium sp. CNPSo 3968]MDK4720109.1 hypothetical protein [Rhizobium sp. CNPSo 3968]